MLQNLSGWHALLILAVVLLVFGSAKLPALAKGVGQSMRILKDEVQPASAQADATPTSATATVRTAASASEDAASTTTQLAS